MEPGSGRRAVSLRRKIVKKASVDMLMIHRAGVVAECVAEEMASMMKAVVAPKAAKAKFLEMPKPE